MKNTTELGREAEDLAKKFYEGRGFLLLDKNFHSRRGEIDLILKKGELLLFVEVKSRRSQWEIHAWHSLLRRKVQRLQGTIRWYLALRPNLQYREIGLEFIFITHGRVEAVFPWP